MEVYVPALGGAMDGGLDMIVGTVVMGPAVFGGKMWAAGRPTACD
jgi:predicted phage tail protein